MFTINVFWCSHNTAVLWCHIFSVWCSRYNAFDVHTKRLLLFTLPTLLYRFVFVLTLQLFWCSGYAPVECIIQSCWRSHYTSFDVHITVRLLFTLNSCWRSHYTDILLCSHHNFFSCSYVKHCSRCPYCVDLSDLITVHSVCRWHCIFSSHFSFGVHIMLLLLFTLLCFWCSHDTALSLRATSCWKTKGIPADLKHKHEH